jgi:glucosamine-6-phosphate deaminase
LNWETLSDYHQLSARGAHIFLSAVRDNPHAVLGLPTGRTPIGMYDRVVQECSRDYTCFRDVITFNLDEYAGITRDDHGSYFTFMKEHLFDHVDLNPGQAHLPNGMAPDLDAECARYEQEIKTAGGIDVTFLGLGRNGHIGFNEPGAPFDSRTRVVELTESTRSANASLFDHGVVPTHAITMGIGTILESRKIVMLVTGSGKEQAVARLRSGEVTEDFPASALWKHPDVTVLVAGV